MKSEIDISEVIIYTDGACAGNPGPGGWGALLKFQNTTKEIWGHELSTTNNRMEITAAIEALKILKRPCSVTMYTDSKYLQQGITTWIHKWVINNWCKSNNAPVKNKDLWQNLYTELGKHKIVWKWVKAHASDLGNIAADKLANIGKETAIELMKCHT